MHADYIRSGGPGDRDTAADHSAAKVLVERVRKFTDLPVAVGFAYRRREIGEVWEYADAAFSVRQLSLRSSDAGRTGMLLS